MPGDRDRTHGRILAGLQRLSTFQYEDGMFSIWCGGQPGVDITARVAHRLLGLGGLDYGQADEMQSRAKDALLSRGHRDNALLPLDGRFGEKMRTAEDAVAYYFAGNGHGRRDEALALLRREVRQDGSRVCWKARTAWGGDLEVTADGARVMADAGDSLFRPAFAFVTSKLINGRLYSTADTRALVELLASLRFEAADTAIIDGREVALAKVSVGREVTALSDNLVVRLDETLEIDHLEPRADFHFSVEPSKRRLRLGERIQITVTPREETIAPLVRLFLPGNLALLKGGANAQTAYMPIEEKELVVDAVAVRPGRGRLFASIHDMYDSSKIGTIPGIQITVQS